MKDYRFVTLDVFAKSRFGGNPLAVFPDADGLCTEDMLNLAREFNMSEVAFVQSPQNPENTARVRIFTPGMELEFAGHPNVGTAWLLASESRDNNGLLRFEQGSGIVEVEAQRVGGRVSACKVAAPLPLTRLQTPCKEAIASCAGLSTGEIGPAALVSVGLSTICVPVSDTVLSKAVCKPDAFRKLGEERPDLAKICLLYLYAPFEGGVRARMFAPLSGTIEDPATGSAAGALTAHLLSETGGNSLSLDIIQGVEMGRTSHMHCEARYVDGAVRAWISGSCIPVMEGKLL
jgi:trans-2,3-dihydro-3-hydroxyanthranilate isomerase